LRARDDQVVAMTWPARELDMDFHDEILFFDFLQVLRNGGATIREQDFARVRIFVLFLGRKHSAKLLFPGHVFWGGHESQSIHGQRITQSSVCAAPSAFDPSMRPVVHVAANGGIALEKRQQRPKRV
jgi:hypothetical protein